MAEASVALKESPGELIFDPTEFPSLTVRVLPAGMITGCGAGAGTGAAAVVGAAPRDGTAASGAGVVAAAGEFMVFPLSVFDGALVFDGAAFDGVAVLLAELDVALEAVSAGFREQATSVNNRKMGSKHSPRERIIFSSERRICGGQNCNPKRAKCANSVRIRKANTA
jgi:hypothetical protein